MQLRLTQSSSLSGSPYWTQTVPSPFLFAETFWLSFSGCSREGGVALSWRGFQNSPPNTFSSAGVRPTSRAVSAQTETFLFGWLVSHTSFPPSLPPPALVCGPLSTVTRLLNRNKKKKEKRVPNLDSFLTYLAVDSEQSCSSSWPAGNVGSGLQSTGQRLPRPLNPTLWTRDWVQIASRVTTNWEVSWFLLSCYFINSLLLNWQLQLDFQVVNTSGTPPTLEIPRLDCRALKMKLYLIKLWVICKLFCPVAVPWLWPLPILLFVRFQVLLCHRASSKLLEMCIRTSVLGKLAERQTSPTCPSLSIGVGEELVVWREVISLSNCVVSSLKSFPLWAFREGKKGEKVE